MILKSDIKRYQNDIILISTFKCKNDLRWVKCNENYLSAHVSAQVNFSARIHRFRPYASFQILLPKAKATKRAYLEGPTTIFIFSYSLYLEDIWKSSDNMKK